MTAKATSSPVKRGYEFTHDRHLDTTWKPGPGQKYAAAPKARCVVTRTDPLTIWYRPVNGGSLYAMGRDTFEARFGGQT